MVTAVTLGKSGDSRVKGIKVPFPFKHRHCLLLFQKQELIHDGGAPRGLQRYQPSCSLSWGVGAQAFHDKIVHIANIHPRMYALFQIKLDLRNA